MKYGAHLPLIDFDGHGWQTGQLASYVDRARGLGYGFISANDHLVFQRPWLDGIVALASVVDRSGDMQLATTVSLPVIREPSVLAKAAAALDIISGGRLVLGVGPGSSERDYESAGLSFDERWPRFDESIRVLRAHLTERCTAIRGPLLLRRAGARTAPRASAWTADLDRQLGFGRRAPAGRQVGRRLARLGVQPVARAGERRPRKAWQ